MQYLKLEGAPYNDEHFEYKENLHQYELTQKAVYDEFGSNGFGKLIESERDIILKDVRKMIYRLLADYNRTSYDVIEYKIAKKNYRGQYQAREDLKNAMLEQVRYAVISGGDLLSSMHGVNLKTGTYIDGFAEMRRKLKISDEVKSILKSGRDPLINEAKQWYEVDPDDYRSDY